MAEDDFPDVEAGLRAWLRADAGVQAIVAQRVFFGVPKKDPTFPLITVRRSGGGDDPSEATIDLAVMMISCWGGTKEQAKMAASAVRRALRLIRSKTQLSAGVFAHGAIVDGEIWSPDPTDDRARYIVTSRVTATAA